MKMNFLWPKKRDETPKTLIIYFQVARAAIQTFIHLFAYLGRDMEAVADDVATVLILKAADTNRSVGCLSKTIAIS